MANTIAGYHNTLQILNAGTPSVTITATGTIKAGAALHGANHNLAHSYGAVYGVKTGDFTVTNLGLIDDINTTITNYGNAGIVLSAPGTVLNAGTILSAVGEGIYLYSGGSVSNTGTIIGGEQAIFIGGGQGIGGPTRAVTAAFITNTGYLGAPSKPIPAEGTTIISAAISVIDSGTIDNAASGTIVAKYGFGIDLAAGNFDIAKPTLTTGAIINAGKVEAAYGVSLDALGAFTNSGTVLASKYAVEITAGNVANSGTLAGNQLGIFAFAATSISNSGLIESTGPAIFTVANTFHGSLTLVPAGIELLNGGVVTNSVAGLIKGEYGVNVRGSGGAAVNNAGTIIAVDFGISTGGPASVINSGTIEATGSVFTNAGVADQAAGVITQAAASLTNQSTGIISGFDGAILVGSQAAILDNLGTIAGTGATGVVLGAAAGLSNAGRITGADYGLLVQGANTITNLAGGTIAGAHFGILAYNTLGLAATIDNAGIVLDTGTVTFGTLELSGAGIDLNEGGSVTNSSTGTIFGGGAGVFMGANTHTANSIENSGLISGGNTTFVSGLDTFASSGIQSDGGAIINTATGTISGNAVGVLFLANTFNTGATLNNSGRIDATGTFVNDDGVINQAAGVVALAGGSLTNQSSGIITGYDGAYFGSSVATTLDNQGNVDGTGGSGVILAAAGDLGNAGHITGLIAGLFLEGSDSVTNLAGGTIAGIVLGILAETAATSIANAGIIIATGKTFVSNGSVDGAEAVYLVKGGTVSNQGTIAGYGAGIQSFSHLGSAAELARNSTIATTVINSGLIEATTGTITYTNGTVTGSSGGVVLDGGGALTNATTGIITAHFGVYLNGGSSSIANTVDNLGTIDGVTAFGVFLGENASLTNSGHITGESYGTFLYAGNRLTNLAGGTISGARVGVLAHNAAGAASTVVNAGVLTATGTTFTANGQTDDATGIAFFDGGILDNESTGTISGYFGAFAEANTTFINAGTITGTHGVSVDFAGKGDVLVEDPGAVFSGTVTDAAGDGALQLGAGNSTLSGFGSAYAGFSTLAVETLASWDIAGGTIAGTVAFSNNGTITETGTAGLTINAGINGAGAILLNATPLTLNGSVAAGQQIDFAGSGEVLNLGNAAHFAGTLSNFIPGDKIVLPGSATLAFLTNNVLTLDEAGGSISLTFASPTFLNENIVIGHNATSTTITTFYGARPEFTATGGSLTGQTTRNAILNLGTLQAGGTLHSFTAGIANDGVPTADLLSGSVTLVEAGVTSSLGSFSGLAGGKIFALGTLGVTPSIVGALTETIILAPSDGNAVFGTISLATDTLTVAATVLGTPVIAAPAGVTLVPGATAAIGGVSLSEIGHAPGENFTVTLADSHSHISATGTGVAGAGTDALTLTGTLAQVNADLASLTETETISGLDSILLTPTDGLGDIGKIGTIAVKTGAALVPVLSAPASATVSLGHAASLSGIGLLETGNLPNESFTVTLADSHGLLSAAGAGISGAGTKGLTISGSLAAVNADLKTITDNDTIAGADKIILTAGGSYGGKASPATIAITASSASSAGAVPHHVQAATDNLDQVIVIDSRSDATPNMVFLAPATEAHSTDVTQHLSGQSTALMLDFYLNSSTVPTFLPAPTTLPAIETAGSPAAGAALPSHDHPNYAMPLMNSLTGHG